MSYGRGAGVNWHVLVNSRVPAGRWTSWNEPNSFHSCVCFSREGRARYLWTWLRGCRSSSAPTWVTWTPGGLSEMSECWHVLTVDLLLFKRCWVMICAAGSSDEGRRGGRDPSQVLHAELLRWVWTQRDPPFHWNQTGPSQVLSWLLLVSTDVKRAQWDQVYRLLMSAAQTMRLSWRKEQETSV